MTSSNRFAMLLSLCTGKPQVKVDSPHERDSTWTRTFDVCCQSEKKTVEQTLDWPVFRDAMTVIWRRRNVLNSMVVAGGLTPIWCQDILTRRGEIGQLHIYRHAFFFQNCPVVSATLRKWQRYPMQETSFLLFCDCIGVLFVITVMQSIPAWCYFFEASYNVTSTGSDTLKT